MGGYLKAPLSEYCCCRSATAREVIHEAGGEEGGLQVQQEEKGVSFFVGLLHPAQESMADQGEAEGESLLLAELGSPGRL